MDSRPNARELKIQVTQEVRSSNFTLLIKGKMTARSMTIEATPNTFNVVVRPRVSARKPTMGPVNMNDALNAKLVNEFAVALNSLGTRLFRALIRITLYKPLPRNNTKHIAMPYQPVDQAMPK